MPLLEANYKTYIYKRTGSVIDADDLEMIWTRFDNYTNLELRYNYALIEAIEFLLGTTWQDYSYSVPGGGSIQANQPFDHLIELAKRASADIIKIENIGRGGSYSTGRLTTRSPHPSPAGYPDANSVDYGGSPQAMYTVADGN